MPVKILRFRHGGFAAALPHGRVLRIAAVPDGPPAVLWPAVAEDPVPRWIEIDARGGAAWIRCSDLRVDELAEPKPLPPVVAGLLALPHVVGWAPFDDEVVWLVDPARLED